VKQINMGIIGTGWCGGIRADTCAINPAVKDLHIVETRPERLAEVAKATGAKTASADYRQLLEVKDLDAVMISATPEALHYPMARDCLEAGLHVFMEKPIAVELHEADDLIAIANRKGVKFTIGYSQRFNPKYAYVKKCLEDGTLGRPVTALVSRNVSRSIGNKIGGRIRLSPAVTSSAAWAQKSPAAASCRRQRWKPRMISTSSCGASHLPNRSASIHRPTTV
jgi:predicted dehydrogenase